MKKFYTLIFISICFSGFSQTIDTAEIKKFLPATLIAIHDGEFFSPITYGGNIPKAGDNIIIPQGTTVTVSNSVNFSNPNDEATTIYIAGDLSFNEKGKLLLAPGSVVYGNENSILERENKNELPSITIGHAPFFGGNDSMMVGPLVFPASSMPESFLNVGTRFKGHINIINWSTIRECKAKNFEVWRSNNGSAWEKIAVVNATGNTRSFHAYLYMDSVTNTAPLNYYRIKILDDMGRGQYSFIRSVKNMEGRDNLSSR